jgi:TPR repeat protein
MGLPRPELIFLAGISFLTGGCGDRSTAPANPHPPALEEAQPSEAPLETPSASSTKPIVVPSSPPVPSLVTKLNADDQANLGMKYAKGDGVPLDLDEAFKLFTLSAEAGSAPGQYYLGAAYSHGKGVEKDDKAAFKWCLEAAKQGHVKAQVFVGQMYAKGEGVDRDDSEAFTWFERAAMQNDAEAQSLLGNAYMLGEGVARDYAKASELIAKAAAQGDLSSQANLGNMLAFGIGINEDLEQGVMWTRKAAEQGHVFGQYILGLMYATGRGVPKEPSEAIKWYRKAAKQGLIDAQIELADLLSNSFIEQERYEAPKWYTAAAEKGNSTAQFALGHAFHTGKGVPISTSTAAAWYEKAANQGHTRAMHNLAIMYSKGEGVPKDEVQAAILLTETSNLGVTESQLHLGAFYNNGQGVPINHVEAYKWFLLAGAKGNQEAKKFITHVESVLTPQQRAEGQHLARTFQPKTSVTTKSNPEWSPPSESEPKRSGSGFFITQNGYFITNYHVTKEAASIRLLTKTGAIQAKLVSADPANDLVLLKAEGSFQALPITTSRNVRLGGTVATVGFPNISLQGHSPKLAKGEIASLAGVQDDARWFQISVPVQPGNSGGPLVDELGNVVGVIVAKLNQKSALATSGTMAENVNYAIKSSFLLGFLEATPDAASGLIEVATEPREFEEIVTETEKGSALVLVY